MNMNQKDLVPITSLNSISRSDEKQRVFLNTKTHIKYVALYNKEGQFIRFEKAGDL